MFTYRIILTSPSLPGARFCSHQISLRKDDTDQIRRSLYKKRYYLDEMILKLLFGSAILSISHPNEKDSFIQVCSDEGNAYMVISTSKSLSGTRFSSYPFAHKKDAEKLKSLLACNNLSKDEYDILKYHFRSAISHITGSNQGYSYIQPCKDDTPLESLFLEDK